MTLNPFIPHETGTDRQNEFLALSCQEALFGGAAGGGKSEALLMAALQYAEVPGYAAVLFRRTLTDLSLPGALIDRSREWLAGKASWNGKDYRWRFPSGAVLQFGYCERPGDERRYKSSEFQFIGFDELTELPEAPYRFLFSRLRRREGVRVPLRVRSGSNPGGPGHEWVKRRFVTRPAGRVFVPALLDDNPFLDRAAYARTLGRLDPVSRAQLLAGDWDAHEGGRFRREWFRRYKHLAGRQHGPGGELDLGGRRFAVSACRAFQTCDPAASAESVVKRTDPDWTVQATWLVTPDFDLVWWDCDRFRADIPDIPPRLLSNYRLHRPEYLGVEAVASNRAVLQLCQRLPMVVTALSPLSRDKLVRATKAMKLAQSGRLWLPEDAHWLEEAEAELLRFTGDGKGKDDVVDACSYACECLEELDSGADAPPLPLAGRGW